MNSLVAVRTAIAATRDSSTRYLGTSLRRRASTSPAWVALIDWVNARRGRANPLPIAEPWALRYQAVRSDIVSIAMWGADTQYATINPNECSVLIWVPPNFCNRGKK